jgi:sRNA-binding regulator protein Hfq
MFNYLKILILFLLFEAAAFISFAQKDSLRSSKTADTSAQSFSPDTLDVKKQTSPGIEKQTPDTVFLKNGDRLTGNILLYEQGRLKLNAQGPGIVFIKWQKIFSVSGGNRVYKAENIRKEIFTGTIKYSTDSGKIIIQGEPAQELLFSETVRIAPVETSKDTSMTAAKMEAEAKKSATPKFSADTVFLYNGDVITGKILSFEQGRLKIDAQGPSVVSIKWHKIVTIKGGSRVYKVEDRVGEIYIGNITASKDTGEMDVGVQPSHSINLADVVRIFPLEDDWYRGFKGNLGAGLNYAKSSDVLTANVEYSLYYIISKWRFINDFSYIATRTKDEPTSVRIQVNFQALYALPDKWVLSEISSFNRNDELGVRSRVSFNIGGGNNLVQTEKQRLLVLTGIVHNSERSVESNDAVSNFEWPVSLQHIIYSFASPDLTSSSEITSYVGITESGRYRIDASTDITWEFINNVSLQLSFYYNYDNKIVEGKASKRDYGTVLSLLVDLK